MMFLFQVGRQKEIAQKREEEIFRHLDKHNNKQVEELKEKEVC